MSLAQIKEQAANLSAAEQRTLIAFLVTRQREHDEEYLRSLDRKIDDKDPSHWVELDELKKRYAQ